jgi:hypothetical protein
VCVQEARISGHAGLLHSLETKKAELKQAEAQSSEKAESLRKECVSLLAAWREVKPGCALQHTQ